MPPEARQHPCNRTRPCEWRTRRSTTTHARSDCDQTRRIVQLFTVDVRARFVVGLLVYRIIQQHDTIGVSVPSHHQPPWLLRCSEPTARPWEGDGTILTT